MCYGQEISNALRRARKRHTCDWCGELIEPKTKYLSWFGIVDGEAGSTKLHQECSDAAQIFYREYPGECWLPWNQPRGRFDPERL